MSNINTVFFNLEHFTYIAEWLIPHYHVRRKVNLEQLVYKDEREPLKSVELTQQTLDSCDDFPDKVSDKTCDWIVNKWGLHIFNILNEECFSDTNNWTD
jgi:hypothetical protein